MNATMIVTLIILIIMIIGLALDFIGSDFILLTVLALFIVLGIIKPSDALTGFSNEAMLTVALLFIVSQAVENTGSLNVIAEKFLSRNKSRGVSWLMLRMMAPVSLFSAFLNNTPIVVMFTPMVKKWAENLNLSPSKFLIPLSYATIFGGMCTLIGTSTNLVVHGLLTDYGYPGFTMFELAKIGIPAAVIGFIYLITVGKHLLPDNKGMIEKLEDNPKEYMIEMIVQKGSNLIGKKTGESDLNNLKNIYSIEIIRKGVHFGLESAAQVIQERDRLVFFGSSSAIVDLKNMPFLIASEPGSVKDDFDEIRNQLIEIVVSPQSPVLKNKVSNIDFKKLYGASLVAIHRNGEHITTRLRNLRLQVGDNLLLQTAEDFEKKWETSQDFFLISHKASLNPKNPTRTIIALTTLILMIVGATVGPYLPKVGGSSLGMFHFALLASIILMLTRCVSINSARKSIRIDVLVTIATAFGISKALQDTGTAAWIAEQMISIVQKWGAVGVLSGIYLITTFFTEIITNNAAAALMCPIALSAANQLGVDPKPFFVAIAISSSASFATPIGYQTNLIVQGAGGYRFKDYFRVGLPLNIMFWILSSFLIPLMWSF